MVKAVGCSRKDQHQPCANYVAVYLPHVSFTYNVEMICFPCSIVMGMRNNNCKILSGVLRVWWHSTKQGLLYWLGNQCFPLMKHPVLKMTKIHPC